MSFKKELVTSVVFGLVINLMAVCQSPHSSINELIPSESHLRFIGTGRMPTELVTGTNLAPISMGEYSVQIETYRARRFGYSLSAGIAPEPTKGTLLKPDRLGFYDIGKGYFLNAGVDYLFIKNNADKKYKRLILEPFIGLRVIYSVITEQKIQESQSALASVILFEDVTSGNIGAAFSAGSVINFSKVISFKAGLQVGVDVISNRLYSYGYTPGMGLDWGGFKTQLLATLRCRIAKGERVVDMTRRN
tara:strand:- start:2581 stop:3324 length:744 start_codon:yes stop_codon:yes gene_type:complete